MVELVLKSVSLGLLIAILIGPVFFLLISTSINKGYNQAFYLALGISACDSIYILLISLGFSQFTSIPYVSEYMSVVGGVILMIFGLIMVFKKDISNNSIAIATHKTDRLKYFFRGFLLNLINPSVCIFWLGSVGIVTARYNDQTNLIVLFFLITLTTVLLTDMLKIYLAKKISVYLTQNSLHRINKICGIAMVIFGMFLLTENFR